MRCPFCGCEDTQVKDFRPTDDRARDPPPAPMPELRRPLHHLRAGAAARADSGEEEWQREPFDRDKLARSIRIALRKRPVEPERIERVINSIVRQLESSGETEIPSDMIGELVMQSLASLDQVAYVRFASVYRNFREAKDFGEFIGRIGANVEGD